MSNWAENPTLNFGDWLSGSGGGALSTLLTGLQAYYKLEETSSPSKDSTANGNDAVWNNAPTSVTGKIGKGIHVTPQAYLLSAASATMNIGSGSFSNAGWINLDDTTTNGQFLGRTTNSAFQNNWLNVNGGGAGVLTCQLYDNTPTRFSLVGPTIAAGGWHLVIIWYDSVAQTQNLQVDNGTIFSQAFTTPVLEVPPDQALPTGYIPGNNSGAHTVDEIGYWSRILTTTEKTNLYNGGTGITYPFTGF